MAPIHFGILMVEYQTLDVVGPIDILSTCSQKMIAAVEAGNFDIPKGLGPKGIDIEFHHIAETMEPVALTGGYKVLPSTTCDDCPPLDYLLVGGPDPRALSDRFAEFLRAHVNAGKVLFTTCTGAMVVSHSGVLDGKTATTNHGGIELAKLMSPKVNWVKKQWVVDGNIWTAGGACAGMDMIFAWVAELYGMEIAMMASYNLDYEPRDIEGHLVLPPRNGLKV